MLIESEKYRGYDFEVHTDEDPVDPRKDIDNLGTMVTWHRRYSLGDEQPGESPTEYYNTAIRDAVRDGGLVEPLFLMDHSGLAINTTGFGDPWDSGQVGWIFATRARVLTWFGWSRMSESRRKRAITQLVNEVSVYDQYLRGDVYGYDIPGTEESCWGFYGLEDVCSNAKSAIDSLVEYDRKRKQEYTRKMVQNHVPLEAR